MRIFEMSFLNLVAMECLVSGVLGINLIKEQRNASSRCKLNSLMITHMPLEKYYF